MIYLASPYSHENESIEQERYDAVAAFCAHQFHHSTEVIFSPIVYAHNLAQQFDLGTTALDWRRYNATMLRLSHTLWVMKLDGWEESKGVLWEIDLAKTLFIPTYFIDEFGDHIL
tara:strand:+ start:2960 stop:3304 length:345 start_codon:yes stop_codon:yes gene_type:complete